MQVTLNIEAGQLGETVVDLFKSLTLEQRQQVATEVLREWLQQPYDLERKAFEEKVRAEAQKKYDWEKDKIPEWKIREEVQKFRSVRAEMVLEITTQVVEHFKATIKEEVENDEQLAGLRAKLGAEIKDKFPSFVQNAVVQWFASHIAEMMGAASQALSTADFTKNVMDNIREQLGLVPFQQ